MDDKELKAALDGLEAQFGTPPTDKAFVDYNTKMNKLGSPLPTVEMWADIAAPLLTVLSMNWDDMPAEARQKYVDTAVAYMPVATLINVIKTTQDFENAVDGGWTPEEG